MPFHRGRAPRVVPWATRAEWNAVYEMLYATESSGDRVDRADMDSRQRQGIAMVDMWRSRGRVPVAVDSTATFVELLLEAGPGTTPTDGALNASKDHAYRLQLALALIRFVNGIADQQQRYQFAQPITQLAESVGLPRFLVDLRHAATHDQLPPLRVLLQASATALSFLDRTYWRRWMRAGEDTSPLADGSSNDAIVGGSSDNGDNGDNASANALDEDEHMAGERERCVDLLQAYKDTRKKGDWEVCVQLMTTITVDMAPATVAQSLLDVGMLVPLNKKKRPVLGAESLSDDLYAFWEPLLKQCMSSFGQRRFGELLVLAIVDRLAEADLAHWESTTAGRTDVATEKLRQYSSQSYTFALALWAVRVIIDALASGTDVSTSAVEVRSGTMDTGGSAVLDADYMAVDDDDNDDAASLASMRSSSDAEADDDDDSYDETEADTDIVHFLKLLLRKPSKFTPFMFATIRRSLHDIPEFDEVRASRIKALLDAMAVKPTSVHADTELNADQAERLFEELIARKHVPPIEITDATVVVASSLTDIIATTATSIDPRSPWTIADPMHWREGCPMGTLPSAYCEYAGVSGEVIGDGTRLVFADEVNAVPVKPSAGYVFPDFGTCVQKFETIAR